MASSCDVSPRQPVIRVSVDRRPARHGTPSDNPHSGSNKLRPLSASLLSDRGPETRVGGGREEGGRREKGGLGSHSRPGSKGGRPSSRLGARREHPPRLSGGGGHSSELCGGKGHRKKSFRSEGRRSVSCGRDDRAESGSSSSPSSPRPACGADSTPLSSPPPSREDNPLHAPYSPHHPHNPPPSSTPAPLPNGRPSSAQCDGRSPPSTPGHSGTKRRLTAARGNGFVHAASSSFRPRTSGPGKSSFGSSSRTRSHLPRPPPPSPRPRSREDPHTPTNRGPHRECLSPSQRLEGGKSPRSLRDRPDSSQRERDSATVLTIPGNGAGSRGGGWKGGVWGQRRPQSSYIRGGGRGGGCPGVDRGGGGGMAGRKGRPSTAPVWGMRGRASVQGTNKIN
ncbi:hypothetical protein ACOMHN_001950 [Nucella lapillus]